MLFAKLINASVTSVTRSVQIPSFLKHRLCHELVRSTTHLALACKCVYLVLSTQSQPSYSSLSRVLALSYPGIEVNRDALWQEIGEAEGPF